LTLRGRKKVMATDAQIAANRVNSRRSTGPRSRTGKSTSALNALVHSMRAKKEKLLVEQSYELENRRHKWMAIEAPADDIGEFYVDQKLCAAIAIERAQGAQEARVRKLALTSDQRTLDDVLDLGTKLYFDRCGSMPMYGCERVGRIRKKTSFSGEAVDPSDPDKIVRTLEKTAIGCQWLAEQWAGVLERLEPGKFLQAADRLKFVRLLGAQPADAPQNRDVALVFVGSQAIHRDRQSAFNDLRGEMPESQILWVHKSVKKRWPELFEGKGAAEFRDELIALAEENMARLQEMVADYVDKGDDTAQDELEEHQHGESAHDERLRNYIIKCSGAVSRWEAVFRKHEKKGRQAEARWRTEFDSRDVVPSPGWKPVAAGETREERWRDAERLAAEVWPKRGEPFDGETGIYGSSQRGGLVEMTEFVVANDPTPTDLTTRSESVVEVEAAQPEREVAREEGEPNDSSDADAASADGVAASDSGEKRENTTSEANCNNDTIISESQDSVAVAANVSPVSGLDKVAALPRESKGAKTLSMKRERRLLRRELAKKEMDRRALEILKRGGTATMMMIEGSRSGTSATRRATPTGRREDEMPGNL
jgi:hypothetical protein